MLDSFGTLSVRTYTAGGALPVSGAIVRIFGAEESNMYVSYTLITDNDGTTPIISLPTPSVSLSLTPSSDQFPYSVYDVEISSDGYYSKKIQGVPMYPGIYSILPVNMIPRGENAVQDFPRGNINSQIPGTQL